MMIRAIKVNIKTNEVTEEEVEIPEQTGDTSPQVPNQEERLQALEEAVLLLMMEG